MNGGRVERRLAAILAADVVGYSRLMGEDEAGTLTRLRAHRRELIDPKISEHKGRIVKTTGDGLLVQFPSVVEAVACAVEVQQGMVEASEVTPQNQRIVFRIGINLGDVIVEDDDIHGDGVNVAARLEALAEPGGICVSAIVHDQVRGRFECTFEDMGDQSLKNIVRPVRVYRVRLGGIGVGTATAELEGSPWLPLPDKPSIAVLPFQNMSGDPEQEYFADGMVEEIITTLSRIRWLFVVARNSSFTYKGRAVDVKRVGQELGVRYVLEGSVRKGGGRVRISAQLIEADTGTHLWVDRFDGSLEDVFDLQDRVAANVAGVIEPTLHSAEIRLSSGRRTEDLTTYDLYLRAQSFFWPLDRGSVQRALKLLEQAIARDPRYGPALGWAAICHLQKTNWSEDPDAERQQGIDYARRAVAVAGDDPAILSNAAFSLGFFGEDIATMIGLADRAVQLNPSSARGWFCIAYLHTLAGDPDAALDCLERAERLSPRARVGAQSLLSGMAYLLKREYAKAVTWLLRAGQENPNHPPTYRHLAACYAHMGRLDDARAVIEQLRAMTPIILHVTHFRNPEHRELLLSGLRLAMGETN